LSALARVRGHSGISHGALDGGKTENRKLKAEMTAAQAKTEDRRWMMSAGHVAKYDGP